MVARAKTKLAAPNVRSCPASVTKASIDPLPWMIFDGQIDKVASDRYQDQRRCLKLGL